VVGARLAKNLCTSKVRFVFELLQNADDNHHSRVKGEGKLPEECARANSTGDVALAFPLTEDSIPILEV
jgi:hypothetical protein